MGRGQHKIERGVMKNHDAKWEVSNFLSRVVRERSKTDYYGNFFIHNIIIFCIDYFLCKTFYIYSKYQSQANLFNGCCEIIGLPINIIGCPIGGRAKNL